MVSDALNTLRAAIPQGVALVAVSKFHPIERLMEAYDAGQRVFAESRPQELASKVPQMPSDVEWHFIGHLQTNKLKLVLPYVTLVQSVDSLHLLEAINKWAVDNGRVINVLLELHLGAEQTKHGFTEEEIVQILSYGEGIDAENVGYTDPSHKWAPTSKPRVALFSALTPSPDSGIRIVGLMGMATNTDDMAVVEKDFERIEGLYLRLQKHYPQLTELSIGMSGDWPLAVRHGATMVRIGTDIFGPREY